MAAIFPTNVREFLTFLPIAPQQGPRPSTGTTTTDYSAKDILIPPTDQPILSRLDVTLIPRLTDFLTSRAGESGIGDVSCQSMLDGLDNMRLSELQDESSVSLYGEYATRVIEPVVRAIASAAGLSGRIKLSRTPVKDFACSQKGNFTMTLIRESDGIERLPTCSDEDKAFSVLFSKAEALSRSIRLDVTTKQTGAAAMAVKLALQMITSRVEYGFFFGGFIAIAAQLVRSTDVSRPGHILLLSPTFKLSTAPLVHPIPKKALSQFQANIQTEPFLAIVVAMILPNLIPDCSVAPPPSNLLQPPQRLETIQDPEEGQEGDADGGHGRDKDQSDLPIQVATNAMILHHPYLRSSDIHRIFLRQHASSTDPRNVPTASTGKHDLMTKDLPLSMLQHRSLLQLCRRAPHILTKTPDIVTLLSQIKASRWSTVWTCRAEGHEKPFVIKLVPESHSDMIWQEFYIPAGGWFAFCLEDVGDNLEKTYGLDWSEVKMSMPRIQWRQLVESVKQLHSLGVLHGDLEPRNVAETSEGFKFFDFGRSELHHCQQGQCDELQYLLTV
ncbi:uncharacterized protein ARMOST_01461 [Armillaria ostoyae]|uniref:Protein kinase domain-containing protein n=1 Tax=Armillaria ostoyae TaxID=47428 RepID=A0A284QP80_ARMOS|nr:uncharacterized protein ARMOST_01461 [Armillaria ostoyae]